MARQSRRDVDDQGELRLNGPPFATQDRLSFSILVRGILVTVMWGLVLLSLQRLFLDGPWMLEAMTIGATTILLACVVLALFPDHHGISAASGVLGGSLVWFLWHRGQGEQEAIYLWVNHPSIMIDEATTTASQEIAPFAPYGAFEDALVLVVLLASILCMVLLIIGGSPVATVTVLALLMLVPTMITGVRIPGGLLLGTGIVLALTVWMTTPKRTSAGLVAAGLAVAVAGGLVVAAPETRDKLWNQAFLPSPVSANVPDVTVTLAQDLRARSTTPAFDYVGSSPGSYRFTLTTLTEFADGRWLPDEEMPPTRSPVYRWRQADTITPRITAERTPPTITYDSEQTVTFDSPQVEMREVMVTIRGLLSDWLPLPQGALRVASEDEDTAFEASLWLWTANAPTAVNPGNRTQSGDRYSVTSLSLLSDDIAEFPASGSVPYSSVLEAPEEVRRYLELPGEVPAVITETAWGAAGNRGDRIATALALQEWLRSGEFTYDETAPYDPGADPDDPYSVITALLNQRSGFCVHYASAFAVMARELGLPTRLAVGYASQFDGDSVTVNNGDLHAWPEVYVDDLGWVAFEPTPGGAGLRADTGEDVASEPAEPVEEQSLPQEPDIPEPAPQTDAAQDEASEEKDSESSSAWWFLSLLLLLTVPAGIRIGRTVWRKRESSTGSRAAQSAWDEFVDTAVDLGFLGSSDPGAPKPRAQTAEALIESLENNKVLDPEAAAGARQIGAAMELERYGKATGQTSATNLSQALNISVAGMKSTAIPAARGRAILAPRSLIQRWRRD